MSETQKKNQAQAAPAPITVKSGIQEIPFNGGGKTVSAVRDSMTKVMNLGEGMNVFITEPGGKPRLIAKEDEGQTVVPEGATVEFVKAAGSKG